MITRLHLQNWKSFKDSTVYIDPLTFLIGTNASGKSNVLDAFYFVYLLSKGVALEDAAASIRGGEDWIIRKGQAWTTLGITIEQEEFQYDYHITIKRDSIGLKFEQNEIYVSPIGKENKCFQDTKAAYDAATSIRVNLEMSLWEKDHRNAVAIVRDTLKSVFVLNPNPQAMRSYSKLSKELRMDAGNIAGVIAALKPDEKAALESKLSHYLKPLPEQDINKVTAVTVGLAKSDAMLYCYEGWSPDQAVDARGMSDGTLRFAAIIVALLTIRSGSLLIVEEVDNGLHPSRAKELVKVLREISKERHVDVLCTTHNPVLIDELGNEMIPFISFIKRDQEGNSHVCLLEEKGNLAKLMASGSVGDMMTNDEL